MPSYRKNIKTYTAVMKSLSSSPGSTKQKRRSSETVHKHSVYNQRSCPLKPCVAKVCSQLPRMCREFGFCNRLNLKENNYCIKSYIFNKHFNYSYKINLIFIQLMTQVYLTEKYPNPVSVMLSSIKVKWILFPWDDEVIKRQHIFQSNNLSLLGLFLSPLSSL